ncbi:RNA polymerase sigma factor [Sphingobacterium faecale]|uniref:Sigma-70 family RNA polymerase sigma factor n=1 Tax=Sphingobacterium faecale TaxID=2803775 RepID=A0ABS1R9A3_9SPHI|nr:sigma-70 family RNA polymerase sigma factor [Sphingobacterium faecale]MBL1410814.1 sigma-70 family RNA polymerase sigma factor [Sphingobacterium faecale]
MIKFIDEKHVLHQLNMGDPEAFYVLYERHKRPLAAQLLKLLKSEELVEDTLQDVFLKLWEYRGKIDTDRAFAPLLYRMARNKVTDIYRRAYRDMSLRDKLAYEGEPLAESADIDLIKQEDLQALHKAMDSLPIRQREVFTLHKIEGKSYKEISEMLGISHAAINQHIYRATQSLHRTLNPPTLLLLACLAGESAIYLA